MAFRWRSTTNVTRQTLCAFAFACDKIIAMTVHCSMQINTKQIQRDRERNIKSASINQDVSFEEGEDWSVKMIQPVKAVDET